MSRSHIRSLTLFEFIAPVLTGGAWCESQTRGPGALYVTCLRARKAGNGFLPRPLPRRRRSVPLVLEAEPQIVGANGEPRHRLRPRSRRVWRPAPFSKHCPGHRAEIPVAHRIAGAFEAWNILAASQPWSS